MQKTKAIGKTPPEMPGTEARYAIFYAESFNYNGMPPSLKAIGGSPVMRWNTALK